MQRGLPIGEQPENLQWGNALADQLRPQNPSANTLLGKLVDLDIIERTTSAPAGRYASGLAQRRDFAFQEETQKLVESGVITKDSLVLCVTGHDIPILAQLTRNRHLAVQGVLNAADDRLQDTRVQDQAQSWGDEIAESFKSTADQNGALFVGLELHRKEPIDESRLPSFEALQEYGIHKIVVLIEAPPDRSYTTKNARTVYEALHNKDVVIDRYTEKARARSMRVVVKGVDPKNRRTE